MNKSVLLFIVCFSIICSPLELQCKTIKICTDGNFWFPFSYAEASEAKGIHIDIARKALLDLGFQPSFTPLPWKRCLKEAETGQFDAIVSASYKAERAKSLKYPEDAARSDKSEWRIMQAEYVVITTSDDKYRFNGNIETLPSPVRAPLGYSIISRLKAEGVHVVTAKDIRECVDRLIKGGRGSVVTARQNAEYFLTSSAYKNKLVIHSRPIASKSYFMVFSKKSSSINNSEISAIWDKIMELRENETYMYDLFSAY